MNLVKKVNSDWLKTGAFNLWLIMPHRKIHCENKTEFNVSLGSEYILDYSLLLIDAFTLNLSRIFLIWLVFYSRAEIFPLGAI